MSERDFLVELHRRGFKVAILRTEISGELTAEISKSIKALDLRFGGSPSKVDDSIYISQTSPQILVTLEKFLELAKIKP